MAYDPQAGRRRPKPAPEGPAPVDALLLSGAAETHGPSETLPPPTPAVTPEPANPPPDKLMLNSALLSAAAALLGALLLRHLCRRRLRNDRG